MLLHVLTDHLLLAFTLEHYLRNLDSELCMHLEECHVSAQIYGLRWCRLLLGREFTAENAQIFKLWDYLFACCYEAENTPPDALLDIDTHPNINSVFASVRIAGNNQFANRERRNISSLGTVKHTSDNESSAPDVPQYVCTPLLGALGDLMLAMLLQVSVTFFLAQLFGVLDPSSCTFSSLNLRFGLQYNCTSFVADTADPRPAAGERLLHSAGLPDALPRVALRLSHLGLR